MFDIPVVLFIFRRSNTLERIIGRIAEVAPKRIYLIGDGPRNQEEAYEVQAARKKAESLITWDCEIIKNFAHDNRGVYQNIGCGAKWVFERERHAIFLEDDNLPEVSFFYYCEEMLKRYEQYKHIIWICGTNYLGKYVPEDGSDYVFTKHMLPCGWSSWSDKFLDLYDGELKLYEDPIIRHRIKYEYEDKRLFFTQMDQIGKTKHELIKRDRRASWDFQMAFSIRARGLLGIAPRNNLIENIGIDDVSEHNFNFKKQKLTDRYCGMETYPLTFPFKHPQMILPDRGFEFKIGKIVLPPLKFRLMTYAGRIIKKIMGIDPYDRLTVFIKDRHKKL
jgi:hypothetical protein